MTQAIDPKLNWSRLKQVFEEFDLPEFKAIKQDPDAFATLQDIHDWAGQARRDFALEVEKHKKDWIAKELETVWLERQKAAPELNPPIGAPSLSDVARQRVENKIKSVFSQIDLAAHVQQQAVVNARNAPDHKRADTLKTQAHPMARELHALVDRAADLRKRVSRHFATTRDMRLQNAISRGSNNPDRDVNRQMAKRYEQIRKAHHRLQSQILKRHGIERLELTSSGYSSPTIG